MTAQLPHRSGTHRARAVPRPPQQDPHPPPNAPQQRPTETDRQRQHANAEPAVDGGEGRTTMRFHPYPSPKGGGGHPATTTNVDSASPPETPPSTTLHTKARGKPLTAHHTQHHHAGGAGSAAKQQQQHGSTSGGDQSHPTGASAERRPSREEEKPFRSPKLYPSFHDHEGHLWYRNNPYGELPTVAVDGDGSGPGGGDGFLLSGAAGTAGATKRGGEGGLTAGRRNGGGGRDSSKPVNYCRHHLLGKCNRGAMCRFAHLKQHDVVLRVTRTPQGLRSAPQSIDILGDSLIPAERDDDLLGFALPPSTASALPEGVGGSVLVGNAGSGDASTATSSPATMGSSFVMPSHPHAPEAHQPHLGGVSAYYYLGRSTDNAGAALTSSPPLSGALPLPSCSKSTVHIHAPYATPTRAASRVRANDPYVSPGGVLGAHDDPIESFQHAFYDGLDGAPDDEAMFTADDSEMVSPPLHGISAEEMTGDDAGEYDTFHAAAAAQRHYFHDTAAHPPSGYSYAGPPPSSVFLPAPSSGYAGAYGGLVGSSPRMQRTETLEFVDTMTVVMHAVSGSEASDVRPTDCYGNVEETSGYPSAGPHASAAAAAAAASSHSGSLPASYHSSPSLGFQPSPPLVALWPSAAPGSGGDEPLELDHFSLPRATSAPSSRAHLPRQHPMQLSHRTPTISPVPQQLTPQWLAASFPGAMLNQPQSMLLPPQGSGTSPCGWQGGQSSTNGPILPPYLTGSSCEVLTSSDPPSRYMTPQVTAEEEAILKSLW